MISIYNLINEYIYIKMHLPFFNSEIVNVGKKISYVVSVESSEHNLIKIMRISKNKIPIFSHVEDWFSRENPRLFHHEKRLSNNMLKKAVKANIEILYNFVIIRVLENIVTGGGLKWSAVQRSCLTLFGLGAIRLRGKDRYFGWELPPSPLEWWILFKLFEKLGTEFNQNNQKKSLGLHKNSRKNV